MDEPDQDQSDDWDQDAATGGAGGLDFEPRGDSLVGKIASEIARSIVDGTLPPGADLNSVELASRFGTSRTPVREALMLLEQEGLVDVLPRRRPRVARITFREIEEIYEIRALLNGLMMELFTRNAGEAGIAAARVVYDRMRQAGLENDTEQFLVERARLHDVWADWCGNATLKKALAQWRTRLSLRRLGADRPHPIQRSMLDHERLMMAAEERDAALATALIRSMTMSGLEVIRHSGWVGLEDE